MTGSVYFMEHPTEGARLTAKVDAEAWAEQYFSDLDERSRRVLDVGCGPAVLLRALARRRPQDTLLGIDRSDARLVLARENLRDVPQASLRWGDATALPVESGSFDVVYSRFLFQYLRNPQRVMHELARACAPGGEVMLQDLDGQVTCHYPINATLETLLMRALEGLAATGFDPLVGRKLYHMACRAGLQDVRVEVEPYHLIAGAASVPEMDRWRHKLQNAHAALEQTIGADGAAELTERLLMHLADPDTLTYSVLFTVRGRKT